LRDAMDALGRMSDWHRLLGLMLRDFFTGSTSCFVYAHRSLAGEQVHQRIATTK
jgi:hypothetical protein